MYLINRQENDIKDTLFKDTTQIKIQFTKEKLLSAHLLWEQGVAGSNPATSTEEKLKTPRDRGVFYFNEDIHRDT